MEFKSSMTGGSQQPMEVDDQRPDNHHQPIDPQRVFCTSALIKVVGRAVAVALDDATLPGHARNPHMTILFRKGAKWTDSEIEMISKATDQWKKEQYGHHQAPVTFTISPWGRKSVLINGDLQELCIFLRKQFSNLSQDAQREPHVELFVNLDRHGRRGGRCGRGGRRKHHEHGHGHGHHGHGHGHHGRHRHGHGHGHGHGRGRGRRHGRHHGDRHHGDRQRDHGHHHGHRHSHRHGRHHSHGGNKPGSLEKVKQRMSRMVQKIQQMQEQKKAELGMLEVELAQLLSLLNNADDIGDANVIRIQLKEISFSFKNKRKEAMRERKCRMKQLKHERKRERKEAKRARKECKQVRQQMREEKKQQLDLARVTGLPPNANAMGGKQVLNIFVDGYNVVGCDSNCRRAMRGRRGGMRRARQRLTGLLQTFADQMKNNANVDYSVALRLWFDGNGKDEKIGDVQVEFSSKKQIVDDKLVELLGKNTKEENSNVLVITSDRELTLRLFAIGVKVMKSGDFYRMFLEQNVREESQEEEKELENDGIQTETLSPGENDEDDFVQLMAKKLNLLSLSGDGETSEGNGMDDIDDEFEDEGNDDYTTIFGEDDEQEDANQ